MEGRNNIRGISPAVGVQHAQVHQARARSHAGVQAVGAQAGTSQNACDVSAVPKWVGTNGGARLCVNMSVSNSIPILVIRSAPAVLTIPPSSTPTSPHTD